MALRALINHSLGSGTHEGYVIMNPERLREPTQRIAERLKVVQHHAARWRKCATAEAQQGGRTLNLREPIACLKHGAYV